MKNTKKYKNNLLQKRQQLAKLYEIMEQLGMVGGELEFPEHLDFVSVNNFVDDLCLYNDLPTIKKLLIAIIIEPFDKIKEGEKEDISSMATYNPDEEWVGLTSKEALEIIGEHCNEYDTARNRYQYEYSLIEKDLEVLEIIKKHKLLNYVTKNKKCADMYHLNDSEIELLKEWIKK